MSPVPRIHSGNGAFFFPSVTVHDSIVDLDKPPDYHERKIALIHHLPDVKVIVTDDGLICLVMQENEKALDFLNTIFATALTWNIPSQQIRSNDLCSFRWEEGSDRIQIPIVHEPSVRNLLAFERDDEERFSGWKVLERTLVPPSTLKDVLNRAYEYSTKPKLQEDVLLLAEAWSLSFDGALTASFLYAWMVIETFLARTWNQYVDSLGRSANDREALRDHRSWTSYHHIEMFSFVGKMAPEARGVLNSLRKKRNDIVHNRDKVNMDEVKTCLNVAARIFFNQVHNPDKPFLEVK